MGWAGQVGELGRLGWTGKRQVSLCFIFFCSVLFYLICFATVLNLKIIQTMPKTPLKIFMLLNGFFQKHIEMF